MIFGTHARIHARTHRNMRRVIAFDTSHSVLLAPVLYNQHNSQAQPPIPAGNLTEHLQYVFKMWESGQPRDSCIQRKSILQMIASTQQNSACIMTGDQKIIARSRNAPFSPVCLLETLSAHTDLATAGHGLEFPFSISAAWRRNRNWWKK